MKRLVITTVATALVLGASAGAQSQAPPIQKDWPAVGNDPGGMKYSTLTQITPANVTQLTKTWTYDTGAPASG